MELRALSIGDGLASVILLAPNPMGYKDEATRWRTVEKALKESGKRAARIGGPYKDGTLEKETWEA